MDIVERLRQACVGKPEEDYYIQNCEAADEIERLREALQGLLRIADGVPMSGIEAERLTTVARSALQKKENE